MQQRILIVLENGAFQGASITSDRGDPLPLDLAALAEIVPSINTASLAGISALQASHAAETDTLHSEIATLATGSAEKTTRISQLEAQIAALTPPESDLIGQLNQVFQTAIPADLQATFAAPYAIVRVLIQAGQTSLARAVIEAIEAPVELEAAKQEILALLPH